MAKQDLIKMVEQVRRLVEISSPTYDLAAVSAVIAEANQIVAQSLGSPGEVHEANGRPILHWGAPRPSILLLCHLDTVWPHGSFAPSWSVEGDRMRGPGVFDMKTGFVQGLNALSTLLPVFGNALKEKVALIATSDEETGSETSRRYIEEAAQSAKAAFILEASVDGKLKTARSGTSMYRLEVIGKAVHAGLEPENGVNATVEASYVVPLVAALSRPEVGTTVTPTVLQSGTTLNTVPGFATLDVDVRAKSATEQERVDSEIRKVKGARGDFHWSGGINRPPLEESASASLYELAEAAAARLSLPPIGQASVGGASDGNFTAALGIPTLDGIGAVGGGAHAPDEWASVNGMEERSRLLAEVIRTLL